MYSLILCLCYIIQNTSANILQNRHINTPNFALPRNTISANHRNLPISGGLNNNFLNPYNKLLHVNSNAQNSQRNALANTNGYTHNNYANNPNLVEASVSNVNLAHGYNINAGAFTPAKNPVIAEALARQNCGVKILADALQVTGTVNVNGKYPVSANVAISGRLPNDGTATVVW